MTTQCPVCGGTYLFCDSVEHKSLLYFGVGPPGSGRGHYWHYRDRHPMWRAKFSFRYKVDTGFLQHSLKAQVEGEAVLVREDGWTILSFWDRSGDSRRNSNSAFAAYGDHTFENLLAAARIAFPWVFDRINFEITERKALHGSKENEEG